MNWLALIAAAYVSGITTLWALHILTDGPAPPPWQWDSIWRTPPPAAVLVGAPVVALLWWLI